MELEHLLNSCSFERVTPEMLSECRPFTCGHNDLDEFFSYDYQKYSEKLLGKTYAFRLLDHPEIIINMFTLSNDSVAIKRLAPEDKNSVEYVTENGQKNLRRFPGVLIGRLGTNNEYSGLGYGTAVMDFIKAWFRSDENKTGCRFLIVDAQNISSTLRYYEKNDFKYLYQNEVNEAKAMGLNIKNSSTFPLHTRLMYFDLINIGR